jgi:hypothetical protein
MSAPVNEEVADKIVAVDPSPTKIVLFGRCHVFEITIIPEGSKTVLGNVPIVMIASHGLGSEVQLNRLLGTPRASTTTPLEFITFTDENAAEILRHKSAPVIEFASTKAYEAEGVTVPLLDWTTALNPLFVWAMVAKGESMNRQVINSGSARRDFFIRPSLCF